MFYMWSSVCLALAVLFFLPGLQMASLKASPWVLKWEMAYFEGERIIMELLFDPVSLFFASVVFFVAGRVLAFSGGYMRDEDHPQRFLRLVGLFLLSMLVLIFSGNLFIAILGWDGLGLTSYLLVVYYQDPKSLRAGMLTALRNRVGDVALILALAFGRVFRGYWTYRVVGPLALLILVAALSKRAQFPFSAWLPRAIAAPTPVSALVHSSTLVTAGVYLLIRSYSGLAEVSWFQPVLLTVSLLTLVLAGLAALTSFDIKEVVAHSTLSQLRIMMVAIALGHPMLAFIHLLTHAMFKALLFIAVGRYIYYSNHNQDLRRMGGLAWRMPVTWLSMVIALMGLTGVPFLSGFYSKDAILEAALGANLRFVALFALILGVRLTSAYSFRLVYLTTMGESRHLPLRRYNNESGVFVFALVPLTLITIVWGRALTWALGPAMPTVLSISRGCFSLATILFGGLIYWVRGERKGTFLPSLGGLRHYRGLLPLKVLGWVKPVMTEIWVEAQGRSLGSFIVFLASKAKVNGLPIRLVIGPLIVIIFYLDLQEESFEASEDLFSSYFAEEWE